MRTRQRLIAGLVFLSSVGALGAKAQDADCIGNLGAIEVHGNLNIAATCRLTGTEIRGNVTLFAGGSLVARDMRVLGNVEGRRANFVDIDESAIAGNLRLEEFVGDSSTIQRSDVGGNAELKDNRSRLEILNNEFGRRVQLSKNRGGVVLSGNSVGRDLTCTGNNPAPAGLGNRVDGNVRGQCRDLQPGTTSAPPATPPPLSPPPTTSQPPPTSQPPASPPPVSRPPPVSLPPTTSPPVTAPPSSQPPASSPPPTATPATSAPPASAPPPAAAPPSAATPSDPLAEDDGGAGAFGWPVAFLLPLLAWRRFARRRAAGA